VRQIGTIVVPILALMLFCIPQPTKAREKPVFRAPFVLKLRTDSNRYYEEKFDRVPYVVDNDTYLFAGETLCTVVLV
jgi:hypothetical protein